MSASVQQQIVKADESLSDFVYCFSSIQNLSDISEGVIIPNGRIDLTFSITTDRQFRISLLGLETKPKMMPRQPISSFFAINFNPLAVEYLFKEPIAGILNQGKALPGNFWDFSSDYFNDFDTFCAKASQKIRSLLPKEIDERKRRLFELIFATNGEISVKELSESIAWSERQMNRYFSLQFGLPVKAYCNILRFQASLPHIQEGKLYPQLNFTDQSHFIREIKKLSGVSPKELFKNENYRFLQFQVKSRK